MGIFKEITDTIKDVRNELTAGDTSDYLMQKRYSSIARQSMEGTLQFPVLVSRSLDIDTAQIISKALEREFASFTQIVLSMNPYLDLKKDKDVAGYLRRFHQNTGTVKSSINDLTLENACVLSDAKEDIDALFVTCEGATRKVIGDNRKQLESILEHINMNKLNDMYKPQDPVVRFKNGDLSQYYNNRIQPLTEAKVERTVKRATNGRGEDITTKTIIDPDAAEKLKFEREKFAHQQKKDDLDRANKALQSKQNKQKMRLDEINAMSRTGVKLSDNDAKKANELVPTMMTISLNVKEDGNFGGTINFMLGVKSILHPLNSDEMINNLVAGCKNSNKFFNFIRWTSGETSFLKDFILNISEIKTDVYNKSAGSSHWWTTLKRRKTWAKNKHRLMVLAGGGKRILPNATIVVTMEEVEYIKSNYGFDLMDLSMVDKIMKEYFLLSFVVVDSSLEVAHFLFDGQMNFESVSFKGLEKENNNKNDFKEVMKMVNSSRL